MTHSNDIVYGHDDCSIAFHGFYSAYFYGNIEVEVLFTDNGDQNMDQKDNGHNRAEFDRGFSCSIQLHIRRDHMVYNPL